MNMNDAVKVTLGPGYAWDEATNELQYYGNPLAYWQTPYEERMVAKALVMVGGGK